MPPEIRIPIIRYVTVRPAVYSKPENKTLRSCPTNLPINDIAEILAVKGHGLIEVRIPSQIAVDTIYQLNQCLLFYLEMN